MLLYHYAKRRFKVLKTRRAQRKLTPEELNDGLETMKYRGDVGPYYDHISFFVEPLPLGLLATLYAGHKHRIWNDGQVVYQHVIESKDIGDFVYELVETPFDIQYMNDHWPDHRELTDVEKKAYFQLASKTKRQIGEIGKGETALETVARKFVGKTAAAFIHAATINDAEAMRRYAASVPHVMIYPESGVVQLTGVPREELIKATKLPPSANWR